MSVDSRRRPGRPANTVPTIDWKVHIPIPIAAKIDILLLDPVTQQTRHGARSAFVTQLLVEFLAKRGVSDPRSTLQVSSTNLTSEGGDSHGNQEG